MASLASWPVAQAQPWDVGIGPNLVRNESFEEVKEGRPVGWSTPAAVYSSDETTARSGARSLKYVNDDPGRYLLCGQRIDLKPGCMYEVKAWVKTQGIKGDESGATVCIEWQDADGKYLGGYYASGKKGDTPEWAEIGGISGRVAPGAARGSVTCYVRPRMTGMAWWDDVSVRRVRQRPIYSLLVRPSYRGWILPRTKYAELRVSPVLDDVEGGGEALRLSVRLTKTDATSPTRGTETPRYSATAAKVVAEQAVEHVSPKELRVRLPLPKLAPAKYELTLAMVRKETGEVLFEDVHRLERRRGPMPKSYVDEHNRLIVNGKPFFPLGMYFSGVKEEELRVFTEAPFNCLMPYGRLDEVAMDLCHRMGLKVLYSIKDFYHGTTWCPDFIKSDADEEGYVREYVRRFRDHPALLGWYTNDERPLSMLDRLEAHQRWVEQEDPNHPTWVVLFQVGDVACYAKSFDVIGTDPYPIPGRPVSLAGQWARRTREAVDDARAVWMVPQVFSKAMHYEDPQRREAVRGPTYEEMRSMTWQCIAEGADGLVFYSWFELRRDTSQPFETRWPDVKRIAAEVAQMIPVLLSVEPVPPLQVTAPESIHWTTRRREGAVYLVTVNDSEEPARVIVRFPKRVRRIELEGELVPLTDEATLDVVLPALGVSIHRIKM
jgi:hypothetical protein